MITAAYLGPEGTNTHLAAQAKFGSRARYVHAPTVEDVFSAVERERADVGVVPIENSLEGAVTHTLDRFIDFKHSPVRVVGEIQIPIRHYFVTKPGVKPADVEAVYSHPQALAQCRKWIEGHLNKLVWKIETNSTSEAVRIVGEGRGGKIKVASAIGHKEAARQNGLSAVPIPDDRDNKTRFLVIGLSESAKARKNKTSVLFALKDAPGALHDALMPFKRNKINLTKIESRPSKQRAWEYLFFVDIEGHETEPQVQKALLQLKRSTALMRVLGSYPMSK